LNSSIGIHSLIHDHNIQKPNQTDGHIPSVITFILVVTMHPERASFLAGHLLGEHPAFGTLRGDASDIFVARKFNETTNALEQLRTPSIGGSLVEIPALHYPHRVEKTSYGRNWETPEILEHTIFTV